jgi:carbonic anhydrase/acetyltransferase-like protein (isoleucine patch superfamily)
MTGPQLIAVDGHHPELAPGAWAAPGATLAGRVRLAAGASLWYAAVLRAEAEPIAIGEDSNVQDGCVAHTDPGFPTTLGARVSVGHRAVLHGCTVADDVLIGMGAVLLNGSRVGPGSLIAAGAVLLEGTEVPAGSLVAGVPGKVRRELTDDEAALIKANADHYRDLARRHAAATR